jgi:hypothetical protein
MKSFLKILSMVLVSFFCIIFSCFACKTQLFCGCKPPFYTKEQLKSIEEKYHFKLPKLAKRLYKHKISISDLVFVCRTRGNSIIECIPEVHKGFSWKDLGFPTETAIPFGSNDYGDTFFVDENCIWYQVHEFETFHLFEIV